MSKQIQNNNEEIDLGTLFKSIGKGFSNLFAAIASFFTSFFNVLIQLLNHFRKNIVWYAIAILLGVTIGYFVDKKNKPSYGANLFIETNFDSQRQVYENIQTFHQLAAVDMDSLELSKMLEISVKDAATIRGFYIEPDIDEESLVEKFAIYKENLDSISKTELVYKDWKEELDYYSFKTHKIGVVSSDRKIFQKLQKNFAIRLGNNNYLKKLVTVNKENLEREGVALETQKKKIDTLVSEYLKIRINESKKGETNSSGTNLYMGNANQNQLLVNESSVLAQKLRIEEDQQQVYTNLVKEGQIINVLGDFPNTGYDVSETFDKKMYLFPLTFFLFLFLFLFLKKTNNYLKEKNSP